MQAHTPSQVLACLRSIRFDLVVLDMAFVEAAERAGGGGSREFLDAVLSRGSAPVLVLGRKHPPTEPADTADGHDDGEAAADAVRRVVALLPDRGRPDAGDGVLTWGPLALDQSGRQAWWQSAPLELTPVQFRVLAVLAAAEGAVVSSRELARRVWRSEGSLDRERIFAHIRRIRKKIEEDPANPRFLLTVRGEGFRLPRLR